MLNIGVHIVADKIKAGIVDENGNIISKRFLDYGNCDYLTLIKQIESLIKRLLKAASLSLNDIASIGIGIPGSIDARSGKVFASYNTLWQEGNIVSDLKNIFHKDIFVSNDAICEAIGEAQFGASYGFKNSVLLHLGVGVGCGIVVDSKPVVSEGIAPAHMKVEHNGRLCTCGSKGCLEAYISTTAIKKRIKEEIAADKSSIIATVLGDKYENISTSLPFNCVKLGDAKSIKIVEEFYDYFSIGLSNIINILRPDIIVLNGSFINSIQGSISEIWSRTNALVYGNTCSTQLSLSSLGGDSGFMGASLLVNIT